MVNMAKSNKIIKKYNERNVSTEFDYMEVNGHYGQRNFIEESKIQH